MSTHRVSPRAGFVDPAKLPRGPGGRALCRQCGLEVPEGRRSFCSRACVDAWKIKTAPSFVRRRLLERDRGVCALCRRDCLALFRSLERRTGGASTGWGRYTADPGYRRWGRFLARIRALRGLLAGRVSLWEADHVVPVIEGGGECGLEGYRTLCCCCHRRVTAELAARRARARRESRQPSLPGLSAPPARAGRG